MSKQKNYNLSAEEVFNKRARIDQEKGKDIWADHVSLLSYGPEMNYEKLVDLSQKMSLCKVPINPILPSKELMLKRIKLMKEEMQEFEDACNDNDIVGMFDALLDQEVILRGTISELGFNKIFPIGFKEVCSANYTKAGEDGIFAVNGINVEMDERYPKGKFLKNKEFYQEPNLLKVIFDNVKSMDSIHNILKSIFKFPPISESENGEILSYHLKEDWLILQFNTTEATYRIIHKGVDTIWTRNILDLFNKLENVYQYPIIKPESGYVRTADIAPIDQTK